MTLRLIREPSLDATTLGVLFLNGRFQCFTLEDLIREQIGQPVASWKVAGATAIPAGHYRVQITPSVRFGRPLPELLEVPGFTGIRIHPGNAAVDTAGCLLVGNARSGSRILQSRVAFEAVFAELAAATDPIWITIENPAA